MIYGKFKSDDLFGTAAHWAFQNLFYPVDYVALEWKVNVQKAHRYNINTGFVWASGEHCNCLRKASSKNIAGRWGQYEQALGFISTLHSF